ncbi:MAG TPA: TraB/GumN family protein [Aromatoleum sp.]|uniref:TraB/GumN family protein n=1 Tax=Aromatoleum sp. TaxID=2307007 RepID=UPI002B46A623|nr:TraB/GumN family protein [Aromatoleum sp.]HJV26022.1 TraB/GumN family protein [Aromatoleum sp.]
MMPFTRLLYVLASFLLMLAGSAQAAPFEHGLLWEITRPGVAPSYLFGTMHIADPRVLKLPPPVAEAFSKSRTFALELYPDEAVAQRFSEASQLENGGRLSRLLSPSAYAELESLLAQRGLTHERLDHLKPWAALLLATAAAIEGGESLDISLYVRARYANKRVEELDSVEEQIAVFDDLPEETQLALLTVALERYDALHDELEDSIRAYLRRNLAELTTLARRNAGTSAEEQRHFAIFEKKIIEDRSVTMAYRLQTHLRRGHTFAAVGALHLYGNKGMLKLLQNDGWQVRRIY